MKGKILTMLFCFSLAFIEANAQVKVSGTVLDADNIPLVGVSVIPESKVGGVNTDINGKFSIELPDEGTYLIFSSIGFEDQKIYLSGRKVLTVIMQQSAEFLDEVVVIGYGMQKKQFVVGSVSSASSGELLKAPTTDVKSMLTGRLAGMTNIQKTGTPGEQNTTTLVRGYTSFNSSAPLVIVDGVPRAMDYVNPSDIESVSVLKDAATAAIYGVRGANGVILITTKSGALGKANISYDGSVTFTTNTAEPDLLTADEYIYWHNKGRELDGQPLYYTPENLAKMKDMGILGETNWLREIFKPYGFNHQHNVSASGGTEKIRGIMQASVT